MPSTGASGGTYRGQILAFYSRIPAVMQAVRLMLRQLLVAYKSATRLASAAFANVRLRKMAATKARQLVAAMVALASQVAKWRRLIEFLATQIFKKTTAAPTAPETEPETTIAPLEPTAAPESDAEPEKEDDEEPVPAKSNPELAALARYSSLDAVSRKTRSRAAKKKRSGSADKIAALRRKK